MVFINAPRFLAGGVTDYTRWKPRSIVNLGMAYKGLQKTFLDDAFELRTFRCLKNRSELTLSMSHSLYSSFGAEATSFLVKTFYCDMEDVIYVIAQLLKYPVDQQTAESDIMACEITYY